MKEQMSISHNSYMYTGSANYSTGLSTSRTTLDDTISHKSLIETILESGETKGYQVMDVVNWFLKKSDMTHKKLQKLCYYAQAWSYALNNRRLMNTDFQAWVHGPVSPTIWERFKQFGFDTIRYTGKETTVFAPEDERILESVWETYGNKTGNALEALSHRELPWIETRKGYLENEKCTKVIKPELMKEYYRSIYIGG